MNIIDRKSGIALRMGRWIRENLDIVGILLVGILIRSVAFGSLPPGLNQDEAATAYDAWAVLTTGMDRNGVHLPMMFVSWGSGMYALSGYLAWPFMLIGGLNEMTARLPHLFLGVASLILMYVLALRCTQQRRIAVLTLFFLAINPWHIMISRWGLDSNILPGFFLIAVTLLVCSLENPRMLRLSAVMFGLCLYLYGTAYVVVPVFLFLAGIALYVRWHVSAKHLSAAAAITALVGLPVLLFVLINQFQWQSIESHFMTIPRLTGTPRFQGASSIFGDNILHDSWENLRTFWHLLLHQDDGLIWNRFPPYGVVYPIGLPFVLIGILATIHSVWEKKGKHPLLFILLWLIAAIVLASLQSVNINRINIIFLPLIFFLAIGVHAAAAHKRLIFGGIIGIFSLFFLAFSNAYVTRYSAEASDAFFEGLGAAITAATERSEGPICVTGNANMPYIFVLFYERTDPRIFVDTVSYENPGAEFQSVQSFGRFTFGLDRCGEGDYDAYVLHQDERSNFQNDRFDLSDYHRYAVAFPRP